MMSKEFSPLQIRQSLRPLDESRAGQGGPAPRHSDFDLNGPAALVDDLRPAAVLVPLVDRPGGQTVLLTRRTDHLHHHPGQVSFPGGRLEGGDDGLLGAALREAHEEIGLAKSFVEPAGLLDDYETVTRFLVTPVVGFVQPGFELILDEFEVAEAFEVPLAFVLDADNHQVHSRTHNGQRRRYFVFEYEQHYIWGATAGMLMNFYRRLHGLCGPTRPDAPDNETRMTSRD
jgi:8-oxo-dGTP pyrophosphatase MutT (NUDIX family)